MQTNSINSNQYSNQYYQYLADKNENSNFGAMTPEQQAALAKAGSGVRNATQQTLLGSFLEGLGIKDIKTFLISIAASTGLILGMSKGLNALIRSNKFFSIAKPFDKLGKKVGGTRVFKSVAGAVQKPVNAVKKFFNNLDIVQYLKNPANRLKPKNVMAKGAVAGTRGEAIDTITDLLKKLALRDKLMPDIAKKLQSGDYEGLYNTLKELQKSAGDKENRAVIKKVLAGISHKGLTSEAQKLLNEELINKYGSDSLPKMLAAMTGRKADETKIAAMVTEIGKICDDDMKKLEVFPKLYDQYIRPNFMSGPKVDVKKMQAFFSDPNGLGKLTERNTGGLWTGMNTNIGEALKKYAVLRGDGAETKAGNLVLEGGLRAVEAMSNGVTAPTLMSLLMGMGIYKNVFDKTQEAPKGEKVSTFAEEAVGDVGSYMLFPVSGGLLYGAASLKNWGITAKNKQALANCAEEVLKKKSALKSVAKGVNNAAEKTAFKTAKDAYKAARKVAGKDGNLLQKLLRLPGSILATGLETNPLSTKAGKFLKGFTGGAMRFVLVALVLTPVLIKPIMKVCHKIFGKPTNSNYDKDKKQDAPQPESASAAAPLQTVQTTQTVQNVPPVYVKPEIYPSFTNLINQVKHPEIYPRPVSTTTVTNTTINNGAQPAPTINNAVPVRTYVPSSAGVPPQNSNYDELNASLKRSEAAEQLALRTLAMK